jgi:ribosomal protein L37AE/L43A
MKPILKKICRERGQEPAPGRWQENGWQATPCPNCNRALHQGIINSFLVCDYCGKVFTRKGLKLEEKK